MNPRIYLCFLLGAISGYLSALCVDLTHTDLDMLMYVPGIIFGVFFAIYALRVPCKNSYWYYIRMLLFCSCSFGAYYAAVFSYIFFMNNKVFTGISKNVESSILSMCSGFVGSLLLVACLSLLLWRRPPLFYSMLTIGIGTVLGLGLDLAFIDESIIKSTAYTLFIPWQAGVFVALYLLRNSLLSEQGKTRMPIINE